MIPYGKQYIDQEDIEAVIAVLRSDYITQGPKVQEFEKRFAEKVNAKYAISVSNGTAALHIAAKAGKLSSKTNAVTSPITFAASSNCILYNGGIAKFADISQNGLIDPQKISPLIDEKTKAIIPVDYAGLPCDLKEIQEIAVKKDLVVIEDACHALGAKYGDATIGDCKYADMTVFSFHPVKHITTGEGGMITTNSEELFEKLTALKSHGIVKEQKNLEKKNEGPWYYEMQDLGYNYRLTDIQSALGISQLKKLDDFITKRRKIAEIYNREFAHNPYFDLIEEGSQKKGAYHLYPILLKEKYIPLRRKIFERLRENQLWVQVHYIPVYSLPYYQHLKYPQDQCPNAEYFYAREISIPMYPSMTENDIDFVIKTLFSVLQSIK
jgi:UDP-4-amino-4,6-dideoxy-N-acetyl-beta-L-altrosamine transaminase